MNKHTLNKLGDRVVARQSIDLQPYTTIKQGETGRVLAVNCDGSVEIKLDDLHKGLDAWNNVALLVSPELDHITYAPIRTSRQRWRSRLMWAAFVFICGVAASESFDFIAFHASADHFIHLHLGE